MGAVQALVAYQTVLGKVQTSEMRDGQVLHTIARDAQVGLPAGTTMNCSTVHCSVGLGHWQGLLLPWKFLPLKLQCYAAWLPPCLSIPANCHGLGWAGSTAVKHQGFAGCKSLPRLLAPFNHTAHLCLNPVAHQIFLPAAAVRHRVCLCWPSSLGEQRRGDAGQVIKILCTLCCMQGRPLSLTVRRSPTSSQVVIEGVANSATIIYPDISVCQGVVHAVDTVLLPVAPTAQGGP